MVKQKNLKVVKTNENMEDPLEIEGEFLNNKEIIRIDKKVEEEVAKEYLEAIEEGKEEEEVSKILKEGVEKMKRSSSVMSEKVKRKIFRKTASVDAKKVQTKKVESEEELGFKLFPEVSEKVNKIKKDEEERKNKESFNKRIIKGKEELKKEIIEKNKSATDDYAQIYMEMTTANYLMVSNNYDFTGVVMKYVRDILDEKGSVVGLNQQFEMSYKETKDINEKEVEEAGGLYEYFYKKYSTVEAGEFMGSKANGMVWGEYIDKQPFRPVEKLGDDDFLILPSITENLSSVTTDSSGNSVFFFRNTTERTKCKVLKHMVNNLFKNGLMEEEALIEYINSRGKNVEDDMNILKTYTFDSGDAKQMVDRLVGLYANQMERQTDRKILGDNRLKYWKLDNKGRIEDDITVAYIEKFAKKFEGEFVITLDKLYGLTQDKEVVINGLININRKSHGSLNDKRTRAESVLHELGTIVDIYNRIGEIVDLNPSNYDDPKPGLCSAIFKQENSVLYNYIEPYFKYVGVKTKYEAHKKNKPPRIYNPTYIVGQAFYQILGKMIFQDSEGRYFSEEHSFLNENTEDPLFLKRKVLESGNDWWNYSDNIFKVEDNKWYSNDIKRCDSGLDPFIMYNFVKHMIETKLTGRTQKIYRILHDMCYYDFEIKEGLLSDGKEMLIARFRHLPSGVALTSLWNHMYTGVFCAHVEELGIKWYNEDETYTSSIMHESKKYGIGLELANKPFSLREPTIMTCYNFDLLGKDMVYFGKDVWVPVLNRERLLKGLFFLKKPKNPMANLVVKLGKYKQLYESGGWFYTDCGLSDFIQRYYYTVALSFKSPFYKEKNIFNAEFYSDLKEELMEENITMESVYELFNKPILKTTSELLENKGVGDLVDNLKKNVGIDEGIAFKTFKKDEKNFIKFFLGGFDFKHYEKLFYSTVVLTAPIFSSSYVENFNIKLGSLLKTNQGTVTLISSSEDVQKRNIMYIKRHEIDRVDSIEQIENFYGILGIVSAQNIFTSKVFKIISENNNNFSLYQLVNLVGWYMNQVYYGRGAFVKMASLLDQIIRSAKYVQLRKRIKSQEGEEIQEKDMGKAVFYIKGDLGNFCVNYTRGSSSVYFNKWKKDVFDSDSRLFKNFIADIVEGVDRILQFRGASIVIGHGEKVFEIGGFRKAVIVIDYYLKTFQTKIKKNNLMDIKNITIVDKVYKDDDGRMYKEFIKGKINMGALSVKEDFTEPVVKNTEDDVVFLNENIKFFCKALAERYNISLFYDVDRLQNQYPLFLDYSSTCVVILISVLQKFSSYFDKSVIYRLAMGNSVVLSIVTRCIYFWGDDDFPGKVSKLLLELLEKIKNKFNDEEFLKNMEDFGIEKLVSTLKENAINQRIEIQGELDKAAHELNVADIVDISYLDDFIEFLYVSSPYKNTKLLGVLKDYLEHYMPNEYKEALEDLDNYPDEVVSLTDEKKEDLSKNLVKHFQTYQTSIFKNEKIKNEKEITLDLLAEITNFNKEQKVLRQKELLPANKKSLNVKVLPSISKLDSSELFNVKTLKKKGIGSRVDKSQENHEKPNKTSSEKKKARTIKSTDIKMSKEKKKNKKINIARIKEDLAQIQGFDEIKDADEDEGENNFINEEENINYREPIVEDIKEDYKNFSDKFYSIWFEKGSRSVVAATSEGYGVNEKPVDVSYLEKLYDFDARFFNKIIKVYLKYYGEVNSGKRGLSIRSAISNFKNSLKLFIKTQNFKDKDQNGKVDSLLKKIDTIPVFSEYVKSLVNNPKIEICHQKFQCPVVGNVEDKKEFFGNALWDAIKPMGKAMLKKTEDFSKSLDEIWEEGGEGKIKINEDVWSNTSNSYKEEFVELADFGTSKGFNLVMNMGMKNDEGFETGYTKKETVPKNFLYDWNSFKYEGFKKEECYCSYMGLRELLLIYEKLKNQNEFYLNTKNFVSNTENVSEYMKLLQPNFTIDKEILLVGKVPVILAQHQFSHGRVVDMIYNEVRGLSIVKNNQMLLNDFKCPCYNAEASEEIDRISFNDIELKKLDKHTCLREMKEGKNKAFSVEELKRLYDDYNYDYYEVFFEGRMEFSQKEKPVLKPMFGGTGISFFLI